MAYKFGYSVNCINIEKRIVILLTTLATSIKQRMTLQLSSTIMVR